MCDGSPTFALKEGELVSFEEARRKRIHLIESSQDIQRELGELLENTKPEGCLFPGKREPAIQGGDGYLPELAHTSNGTFASQVATQNLQNKAQSIRTEGNEQVRKDGVGMPTGFAAYSGNRNPGCHTPSRFHRDHIPIIGIVSHTAANRTAMGARSLIPFKFLDGCRKELLIGKICRKIY